MGKTFLQLTPQWGATCFGPFTGAIRIGSDPKQCQLTVDASHGVYPLHAVLMESNDGLYSLSPGKSEYGLFLIQSGQTKMWPVRSPLQAKPGDTIILGTPRGPRFQIISKTQTEQEGKKTTKQSAGASIKSLSASIFKVFDRFFEPPPVKGGGVSAELARQRRAKMMTKSPWREIYKVYHRLRTGAHKNPVYIVGALAALATALLAGMASCAGIGTAILRSFM
jgi:hypothetical protein